MSLRITVAILTIFLLGPNALSEDHRSKSHEVFKLRSKEYYSESLERLGELGITVDFLNQYDSEQRAYALGQGGLRYHTKKSPEHIEETAGRLRSRLASYREKLDIARKDNRVSVKDIYDAVKSIMDLSKGKPGAGAALVNGIPLMLLLEKHVKYEKSQDLVGNLSSIRMRQMAGDSQWLENVHGKLMEHLSIEPNLAEAFDKVNADSTLNVLATGGDEVNLKLQLENIKKGMSNLKADNTPEGQRTLRALEKAAKLTNLQLEVSKENNPISKEELEQEFKKLREEIYKDNLDVVMALVEKQKQDQTEARLNDLKIEAYRKSVSALSGIAHLIGGKDGHDFGNFISTSGNAILDFSETMTKADELMQFAETASQGTLMAASGGILLVVQFASLIQSLMAGPDITQEMLKELRNQVHELHKEMKKQFGLVHDHLNQIFEDLLTELGRLDAGTRVNMDYLTNLMTKLDAIGREMLHGSLGNRDLLTTLANRLTLATHVPDMVDPEAGMDIDRFKNGMDSFKTCATHFTLDDLGTGTGIFSASDSVDKIRATLLSIEEKYGAQELHQNYLGTYFKGLGKILHMPNLESTQVGNPFLWAYCARMYVDSILARPEMFQTYLKERNLKTPYEIDRLHDTGTGIQKAISQLTPEVFTSIIKDYKEGLDRTEQAYFGPQGRGYWTGKTLDNAEEFGLDEGISTLNGLNPHEPAVNQTEFLKNYKLKEGNLSGCDQRVIPTDEEERPGLKYPPGFLENLKANAPGLLAADKLGLGRLEICYSVIWKPSRKEEVWAPFPNNGRVFKGHKFYSTPIIGISVKFHANDGKVTEVMAHSVTSKKEVVFGFRPRGENIQKDPSRIQEMVKLWNDTLADEFFRVPSVSHLFFSQSEARNPVLKERYLGQKAEVEQKMEDIFSRAREAIHAKILWSAKTGEDARSSEVHDAVTHVDAARYALNVASSYRLPQASQTDTHLGPLLNGIFALPNGMSLIQDQRHPMILEIEPLALKSNRDETMAFIKANENATDKDTVDKVTAARKSLKETEEAIKDHATLIKHLKVFVRFIEDDIEDMEMMSKIGMTETDIAALQKAMNEMRFSKKTLAHLSLVGLYKAIVIERLGKPGYEEEMQFMENALQSLEILRDNFDAIRSGDLSKLELLKANSTEGQAVNPEPTHK